MCDAVIELDDKQKLLSKMKVTKASRFNLSNRLATKASSKSFANNILSLISIIIGIYILVYADSVSVNASEFIGVLVSGVSIVSIFLSLEQPVALLSRRSSDAHRCACEISRIYRELEIGRSSIQDAAIAYEDTLSRYDDNHDRVDYRVTLYEYKSDFPEKSAKINWINSRGFYIISSYSPISFTVFCIILIITIFISIQSLDSMLLLLHK